MRRLDLKGHRFGRLRVTSAWRSRGVVQWFCQCDCGEWGWFRVGHLVNGYTKSCGCFQRELALSHLSHKPKHGHARNRTPTYVTWDGMIQRCTNPNERVRYSYYGGRGVRVCDRWMKFENFLADMGERPKGLTLDRIDGNRGYEPSNCRWATRSEQSRNQRRYGHGTSG